MSDVAAELSRCDGTPLVAPMPGMIVGVEKKEGDTVNEGETILILEAMKMENRVLSDNEILDYYNSTK